MDLKVDPQVNKPLLSDAVADLLPEHIRHRPKQGFTFPFALWMKNDSASLEEMAVQSNVLDAKVVHRIWDNFRHDRCHWSRPWSTLVMAQYGRVQRAVAV